MWLHPPWLPVSIYLEIHRLRDEVIVAIDLCKEIIGGYRIPMLSRLAAVGVSGETLENPTPPSANPAARIAWMPAAKTFEFEILPVVVREVFESDPCVLVFRAASASGSDRSMSTAMTTKTSLSRGFS